MAKGTTSAATAKGITADTLLGVRGHAVYGVGGQAKAYGIAAAATAKRTRDEGYTVGALRFRLLAAHAPLWGDRTVGAADFAWCAANHVGGMVERAHKPGEPRRFVALDGKPSHADDATLAREALAYWREALTSLRARGATLAMVEATPNLAAYMRESDALAKVARDIFAGKGASRGERKVRTTRGAAAVVAEVEAAAPSEAASGQVEASAPID